MCEEKNKDKKGKKYNNYKKVPQKLKHSDKFFKKHKWPSTQKGQCPIFNRTICVYVENRDICV